MARLGGAATAAALLLAAVGCSPVGAGTAVVPAGPEAIEPAVIAEGAAWTWFNDERAVFHGDRLIVGYVDTAGYAGAAVVPLGGEAARPGAPGPVPVRTHRLGSFREVDDHNNPSFVALGDGRVLAAYAAHHTQPYWYWRIAEPEGEPGADSLVWSPERRTPDLGANITYSNLVRLPEEGGRVYNFFRGANFDPTLMVSEDGGRSWGPPRHLIRSGGGGTRPYVKYATDGESRIDLLYTQAHPRDAATDIHHVFYEDGWLHRSDGTRIQRLPDGEGPGGGIPMPVDAGTRVYDAREAGRAWVWDLEYDADGSPVAVYVAARDSTIGNDLRYRYARWDAAAAEWREAEIGYAGTHLYDGENHYAGGITLDPEDPRTVYVSADVHPGTGEPTPNYRIYRGRLRADGGAEAAIDAERWAWELVTSPGTADHIRPFVPRGGGDRRALLWLRGRYTTYTDYGTDVVGLIEAR